MIRISYKLPDGADDRPDDGRLPCVYSFGPCGKCSACEENRSRGLPRYPERTLRERLDALITDHMTNSGYAGDCGLRGHSYETAAYNVDDVDDIEGANEHERMFFKPEQSDVMGQLVSFAWRLDPRIVFAFDFVPWIVDPDDEDETKASDTVELHRDVEPKTEEV